MYYGIVKKANTVKYRTNRYAERYNGMNSSSTINCKVSFASRSTQTSTLNGKRHQNNGSKAVLKKKKH